MVSGEGHGGQAVAFNFSSCLGRWCSAQHRRSNQGPLICKDRLGRWRRWGTYPAALEASCAKATLGNEADVEAALKGADKLYRRWSNLLPPSRCSGGRQGRQDRSGEPAGNTRQHVAASRRRMSPSTAMLSWRLRTQVQVRFRHRGALFRRRSVKVQWTREDGDVRTGSCTWSRWNASRPASNRRKATAGGRSVAPNIASNHPRQMR